MPLVELYTIPALKWLIVYSTSTLDIDHPNLIPLRIDAQRAYGKVIRIVETRQTIVVLEMWITADPTVPGWMAWVCADYGSLATNWRNRMLLSLHKHFNRHDPDSDLEAPGTPLTENTYIIQKILKPFLEHIIPARSLLGKLQLFEAPIHFSINPTIDRPTERPQSAPARLVEDERKVEAEEDQPANE